MCVKIIKVFESLRKNKLWEDKNLEEWINLYETKHNDLVFLEKIWKSNWQHKPASGL